MISSSFVKSSAVKKIGKRTTLHLECRKKREKKAGGERGVISISICLDKKMVFFFFLFGFDYSFFCFSLFPTCNPILPLYPPSFSPPPRLVHPPTPSKAQNESLQKLKSKSSEALLKSFISREWNGKKWNVVSLFFSFFLSS